MPKGAPPNGSALPEPATMGSFGQVSEMQAKLHRRAVAGSGRRFYDLFNVVHDPATPQMASGGSRVTPVPAARTWTA